MVLVREQEIYASHVLNHLKDYCYWRLAPDLVAAQHFHHVKVCEVHLFNW